jgi:hypothetical protein
MPGRGGAAMSAEPAGKPIVAEPTSAGTGASASGEHASAQAAGAGSEAANVGRTGATKPMSADPAAIAGGDITLKVGRVVGAGVGYCGLAAFLYLVGLQVYRWLRDGEWTHFGISEALRAGMVRCCVSGEDTGRLAALVHWIDAPVDWLGLHRVLEITPASLGLFALSIVGNSLFIYCCDRLDQRQRSVPARLG